MRGCVAIVVLCLSASCSSPSAPSLPGVPVVGAGPVAPTPASAAAAAYDARAVVTRVESGAQWFEWPALAGGRYGLFVFEAAGARPVWGWEGSTTKVRFGDVANLDEELLVELRADADRHGTPPRPPAGAQWSFVAFDASGQLAGVRARGPL